MATIDLTTHAFRQAVEDDSILVVDFWAAWCGRAAHKLPCSRRHPRPHTDMTFGKVDTEAEQRLASAAGIASIPALRVFRDGILVFPQPGALDGPQPEQFIGSVKLLDRDVVRLPPC